MAKRYFMTLAGVKCEISEARAAQIRRLQALIRAQRANDSAVDVPGGTGEDSAVDVPVDGDADRLIIPTGNTADDGIK
jgi:hypothetical protein